MERPLGQVAMIGPVLPAWIVGRRSLEASTALLTLIQMPPKSINYAHRSDTE
jgi:hypothetical protein